MKIGVGIMPVASRRLSGTSRKRGATAGRLDVDRFDMMIL